MNRTADATARSYQRSFSTRYCSSVNAFQRSKLAIDVIRITPSGNSPSAVS